MLKNKRIFFAALDWGLGHATRSIPLIRELSKNNSVIIGVTTVTSNIFESEFPQLEKIVLPSYNIRYSSRIPLSIKLLLQFPSISRVIKNENARINKIIEEKKIDVVISDSRYGLYSEKAHSIIITHQLFLKSPVFSKLAQRQNQKYLSNFNEIWVPDLEKEKESLSGELSHGKEIENAKYIGPRSRLTKIPAEKKYDFLILLSGPEPQQHILYKELLNKFASEKTKKIAVVCASAYPENFNNAELYISPSAEKLSELICSSDTIICRSGYSTLMDLYTLEKKKLILIPTPGQTEQEYLAEYWRSKFKAKIIQQKLLKDHDSNWKTL